MTKLAENGRKGFHAFCAVALDTGRQTMVEKGGEGEERRPGKIMGEKG